MIRLTAVSGGGRSIDTLVREVLDELHTHMREQGLEIIRTGEVGLGVQGATWTFELDPPTAGTLTVARIDTNGAHSVTFIVNGIAALTLSASMRAVAEQIHQRDPRAVVTLTRGTSPGRQQPLSARQPPGSRQPQSMQAGPARHLRAVHTEENQR